MAKTAPAPSTLLPLTHLALEILLALADAPRHGYAIITDIEARSGGRTSLRSGTLYTAIQRLRDDGLLEACEGGSGANADPRRKYFRLTSLGRKVAGLELSRLARVVESGRRLALLDDGAGSGDVR